MRKTSRINRNISTVWVEKLSTRESYKGNCISECLKSVIKIKFFEVIEAFRSFRTYVPLFVENLLFWKIIGHMFRYLIKSAYFGPVFEPITELMSDSFANLMFF
uniref:Uncharacterized protein n=1 Tax=Anaerobacillus isosaccharinicus TaxID=1532552 RepID=A0A1S2MEY5_9BACI